MIVTPIKTPIIKLGDDLFKIIKSSIKEINEGNVLVITSKIISVCQGRVLKSFKNEKEKYNLVEREADFFLPRHSSKYGIMLTIKENTLAVNAGVDCSNSDGGYVIWPKDLQNITNKIWKFLRKNYKIKNVGAIIVDSRTIPLRWGVVGTAISHCGFKALYDYRGKKDLFGRKLKMSQMNISEAIATAAVLEMGEADERIPLCLVESITKIRFQKRPPTKEELEYLRINQKDDVYFPLLDGAKWKEKK